MVGWRDGERAVKRGRDRERRREREREREREQSRKKGNTCGRSKQVGGTIRQANSEKFIESELKYTVRTTS